MREHRTLWVLASVVAGVFRRMIVQQGNVFMQHEFNPHTMSPAQPERCIECEQHLAGQDLRKAWDYCDFCGEAVCSICAESHACQELRANKPKKLL